MLNHSKIQHRQPGKQHSDTQGIIYYLGIIAEKGQGLPSAGQFGLSPGNKHILKSK